MLPRFPDPFTLPGSASNEWAVDGRHTATGAPLLAGDPHLAFGFPGIWYLARIETPDGVLAGATAPGVPFLVLGHNGHIAWTFTTTGADVQDVFIETPAGDGQYQTPDGPRPFTVREERIKVRGEPDQVLTVRETRHGPVISDLRRPRRPDPGRGDGQPGSRATPRPPACSRSTRRATWTPPARPPRMITAPVQNLLVADRERIALYVTGRVPIRRAGDGSAPVPGDGSHDWIGWASGRAAAAHRRARERPAGQRQRPHRAAGFPGVPRPRLVRRLARAPHPRAARPVGPPHRGRLRRACRSTCSRAFARQVLPALLAVPVTEDTARRAQALLRDWDGSMTHGRAAAADLQRLDARLLWRACCSRPASP